MGSVSARPRVAFEGRSLHDDALGPASVDEALDALARLAVLTTIAEDHDLDSDIVDDARSAIERLATAGPYDDEFAREVSRRAAAIRGPEPYEQRFKVELEIVTRPYNQWVRDVVVTGTPVGG